MTTVIKSKTLRHCTECDETIRVGEDITRNPDGQWIHHTCHEELNSGNNKKPMSPEDFWNLDDDDD